MATPLIVPENIAARLSQSPLTGRLNDWPDVRDANQLTVLDVRFPPGADAVEFVVLEIPEGISDDLAKRRSAPAPEPLRQVVCQSCGQLIVWLKSKSGRPTPVNPEVKFVAPDGLGRRTLLFREDGSTVRAFECLANTPGAQAGYVSHFATCPKANQHRKRTKRS